MSKNFSRLAGASLQALLEQRGGRVFVSGIVGGRNFATQGGGERRLWRKAVTIPNAVRRGWAESLFPSSGDAYVLGLLASKEKNANAMMEIGAPFSHKLVANGARVLQDLLEHQAKAGCFDSAISLKVADGFLAEEVGMVFLQQLPEIPSAEAMKSYDVGLGEGISNSAGSMFFSPLLFLSCYAKLCGLQAATDYSLSVGQEFRWPRGSRGIGVSHYSPNGNGNLQFYTIEAKDLLDKLSAQEIYVLSQPLFSYKIGARNGLPFAVIGDENGYTSIHFNSDAFVEKKINIEDCDHDLALMAKAALGKVHNILKEIVITKSNSFSFSLTQENSALLLSDKFGGVNGRNPIGQYNAEEVVVSAPLIGDFSSPDSRSPSNCPSPSSSSKKVGPPLNKTK